MKQYRQQVSGQENKTKKQVVVPKPPTQLFSMITCYRSLVNVSAGTATESGNTQLVS